MGTERRRLSPVDLAYYAILLVIALPLVLPIIWMVSTSLKAAADVFAYPPQLIPPTVHPENYVSVFTDAPFARQYLNSLYIGVVSTIGTILVASLAGYAFARIRFPLRNVLFVLLLSALLMPAEVTMIPLFVLMTELG